MEITPSLVGEDLPKAAQEPIITSIKADTTPPKVSITHKIKNITSKVVDFIVKYHVK